MKKSTILYLLTLACFCLIISGYKAGPAAAGQYDCTGAETGHGNKLGCTCHSTSANANIAVTLEMDSAGIPTTHYKGGGSYTITIKGINNGTASKPKYGFQIGSIYGSASLVTPTIAGTWTSPYPTSTHYTPPGTFMSVGVVEHSSPLSPSSGAGGNGTIYSKTFNWTAPLGGLGTLSFWGVLNACNGNGTDDSGDLWNAATLFVDEWPLSDAVASLDENSVKTSIYPNPASSYAEINYTLNETGNVNVDVYNLAGEKVHTVVAEKQFSGVHKQILNISELNVGAGIYIIRLSCGSQMSCAKLVVQ